MKKYILGIFETIMIIVIIFISVNFIINIYGIKKEPNDRLNSIENYKGKYNDRMLYLK